jgi:acylphosphatase
MNQVHLFISGFVQGVGFRYFVRRNAKILGLTGWTRNLSDRRVEIVAQGEKEKLEEFIKICSKGPFLSEIKSVSIEHGEAEEKFSGFEILSSSE